jgi:hypothetical protein
MANSVWFDFLAAFIFLIIGVYITTLLIKRRSKYNITLLIICVVFAAISILSYFYPRLIFHRIGTTAQIIIWVAVYISFLIFLFSPEIKRFVERRKLKKRIHKN